MNVEMLGQVNWHLLCVFQEKEFLNSLEFGN